MKSLNLKKALMILSVCVSMVTVTNVYADGVKRSAVPGGYSNECPGVQGSRHNQVVYCCSPSFWGGAATSKAGCMYGDEDCYRMNPCNGGNWTSAPGGLTSCSPED